MLDLCTNTVSKGESGCIKCIDDRLFDMAKRREIAVLPYNHTESIDSFEFFKHLRENNTCMKIFFPDELMREKIVGQSGFEREYKTILILKKLRNFIENHTPYESYNDSYGFKLIFIHGVKINEVVIHEVNIVLVRLCVNSRNSLFFSEFNPTMFKKNIKDALKLLHAKGYCHKDLHIGNIVLCFDTDKTPKYKLIDFEHMSKCEEEEQEEMNSVDYMTGSVMRRSKLGGKRTQKMASKSKSKKHKKSRRH